MSDEEEMRVEGGEEDEEVGEEEMDEQEMDLSIPALRQMLLDQEKEGSSADIITSLWELSKQQITTQSEGIDLYTTYIYVCRRMGADVDTLKGLFAEAAEVLGAQFGDSWDPDGRFRKNYAYFLYAKANEPAQALKLWNTIFNQDDLRQVAALWLDAVRLERHFGTVEQARKWLNRAVNAVTDFPHEIFGYWLQFEREEGTREQVDRALEKVNAAAARIEEQKQQQLKKKKQQKPVQAKPAHPKANGAEKNAKQKPQKRKADEPPTASEKPAASDEPQKADEKEKKPGNFKFSGEKENNKLFIRNVDFKATEDEIREHFAAFGPVVEVRIVRFKNGNPKGVAYVEFESEEAAQRGLAAHEKEFKGRPLTVLISDPSVAKRGKPPPKKPKEKTEAAAPARALGAATGHRSASSSLSLKPRILL